MKCGFCELDITPSLGSIIPGAFGARYADSVLDPLFVRAFVSRTDSKAVAVAVIDACGITEDITERIRSRAAAMTDIGHDDIMVMATHTHGGGPTLNWGEEVVTDEYYLKHLTEKASDAICLAWKNAEESELCVGSAELNDASFVRIYEMKDGSYKTNPGRKAKDNINRPVSTIDPEVIVMSVKQNGKLKGAVINFATHPATVATNEITGDYISALSAELKRIYGGDFVTVFVNGACGNINHINLDKPAQDVHIIYKEVGCKIAHKAKQAIESSRVMKDDSLHSLSCKIDLRFRKPSADELVCAKALFDSYGDSLVDSVPSGNDPNYMEMFFALQKFIIMADKRTVRKAELQLFRIGECYIAGTPAQLFNEFGKKIKSATPRPCMVSAFANDYIGYVPTPDCMREGVYEARLAPTSALEADSGDRIADAVMGMIKTL